MDKLGLSSVGLLAALAAIAAGWSQVKTISARVAGLFVVTAEFRDGAAAAVCAYARREMRSTASAFRYYSGQIKFIRPKARFGTVIYEEVGERGRLYWRGAVPLWAQLRRGTNEHPGPDRIVVRYLRGTLDPDRLAFDAAALLVQDPSKRDDRFFVRRMHGRSGKAFLQGAGGSATKSEPPTSPTVAMEEGRLIGWREDEIGEAVPPRALDRLALSAEAEEAVAAVRRWFDSKAWYEERRIAWRFGLGLLGEPGTGKSSLVKAVAQDLRIPIYLLDISTMDNEEFHEAYREALSNAPCIVLVEDIDAVFDGRENVAAERGKGLTFDCLLNTVSGVETADGVLLVITTNHPEKLDPALGARGAVSSRPGRIDRMVEMTALDVAGRRKIARRILAGCHESWVERLVALGANDTGAQFEDRCATLALGLYWSKDPGTPAPERLRAEVG